MSNTDRIQEGGAFTGAAEMFQTVFKMGAQTAAETLRNEIVEVEGVRYIFDKTCGTLKVINTPVRPDEPFPETLDFFTLDGLVDYIDTNTESMVPPEGSKDRLIVHVENYKSVVLLSKPSPNNAKRHIIARCEALTPNIPFGLYMDSETFNTKLLSMFEPSDSRDLLFKVTSSMVNEQKLTTSDDGVSQNITLKQGVSLACTCKFENPVPLIPYRTFSEVDQVESNFVMRVDKDGNICLSEADGGAWKVQAVNNIRQYLRDRLEGLPVVVLA